MDPNLWAKRKESKGRLEWLPLQTHLEDTQGVMKKLWEQWLSPGQRKYIQESMGVESEIEAKRVALFVAASHDICKCSPAFQLMRNYQQSNDLEDELMERLQMAGFGTKSQVPPLNPRKSPHALGGYLVLRTAGVNDGLASVIGAHHGLLQISGSDAKTHIDTYPTNFYLVQEKDSPIYKKWKQQQEQILDWALVSSGFESVEELPEVNQPGLVLLSGLIIMADWIASNEHYFPLMGLSDTNIPNSYERIEEGFSRWFESEPWRPKVPASLNHLYQSRFGYDAPKSTQRTFGEVIEKIEEPGIVIFEAPMGMGKTEAALAGAEQLAYKTGMSGIFFGLPTQATSDGMFGRVNAWLQAVTAESGERLPLRLSHGKSALNAEFASLASNINQDELDEDGKPKGSVYVNAWFSGRKTSALDDFVVGTIDNFLLMALRQKHLAMRHLGFTRKVIILDEIHAADAYMREYLYEALTWAGAYKVPVIILSATLPAEVREEMVTHYLQGRGLKRRAIEFPKDGLRTTAYPLMTYTDGNQVYQEKDFEREADRIVSVRPLKDKDLEGTVLKAVADGAVVGLVVNTVKRAQKLGKEFEKLLGTEKVEILHSSFIATARVDKERELLETIGKGGNRPKGKLIIGTQVIEQSLDIDFDLMISDLAPMDLLIQRLGRLQRHETNVRPPGFEQPILYVLGLSEDLKFEEGSLAVYGGYLLTRTQYFLGDEIRLPSDISPLVQKVYDPSLELELDEDLQLVYQDYKLQYDAMIRKKASKARNFCLGDPVLRATRLRKATLNGWVSHAKKLASEEKARAQVRDIQETVEVIAVQAVDGGYSFVGNNEDISETVLENQEMARELAKQTLRLPIHYELDELIQELENYNIKYLPKWQDQPWLEGSLGIIFDKNGKFKVGKYRFNYNEKYGLSYEGK